MTRPTTSSSFVPAELGNRTSMTSVMPAHPRQLDCMHQCLPPEVYVISHVFLFKYTTDLMCNTVSKAKFIRILC
jgi:hypothetical protein